MALSALACASMMGAGSMAAQAETPPLPAELMSAAAGTEAAPSANPTEQPMILLDF